MLAPLDVADGARAHNGSGVLLEVFGHPELVPLQKHPQIVEERFVVGSEQRVGLAPHACPPSPARTVHELADVFGGVVVDDCVDALDVQSSPGQVGGHQDLHLPSFESADHPLPLLLVLPPVVLGHRPLAPPPHQRRHLLALLSRVGEHDDRSRQPPQYFAQSLRFVVLVNEFDVLVDFLLAASGFSDGEVCVVGCEVLLAQLFDFGHHGGAEHADHLPACEQRVLPPALQDELQVIREVLGDHLVRLVHHAPAQPL